MKLSFPKKLTASYLLLVVITLVFMGTWLTPRLERGFLGQLEQSMVAQASLIARTARPSLPLIQALGRESGCRITLVTRTGAVLADSERSRTQVAEMDNHLNRPEIQQALKIGLGESRRHSATLGEDMLYVAVPLRPDDPAGQAGGGVVRVALSLAEVNRRVAGFQKDLLKAGAAALLVALVLALVSVRRISAPLRELVLLSNAIGTGDRPAGSWTKAPDEFGRLAQAFNRMADRMEEKVSELARERTQMSAILASLVESLVALDHQGRVLFLNPAAETLFGVRSADVKNRPFLEVLRHSPLNEVLTQALSDRRSIEKEILLHAPSERVLGVHAIPVDYGDGHTGVLAAMHDITELRRLENLRREFVANVSHELKTPLTSIKGYTETLLEGTQQDTSHNRQFLKIIQEHAEHLEHLIDDVLDLSAIEARRVRYTFEPVAVPAVVERIVKALTPMAAGKKVKVIVDLKPDLPAVRADREKLAQMMMNLIDNAIKFNKTGGRVQISADPVGDRLQIQIADSGIGIPPEDQPRIFERFYRANKDRSHEIPGTGLGLAIVKHLVEAHQGTIELESTLKKGSVFRLILPIV